MAIPSELPSIPSLIKEVESHTPWLITRILRWVIPVIGWIGISIYLYFEADKRSAAVAKLSSAVKKIKIDKSTPEETIKAHRTALAILYPETDDKYRAHLKTPHMAFQREVRTEVATIFGGQWRVDDFETKIFPIYLALAQSSEEEAEALIQSMPEDLAARHPIQLDKIAPLRAKLAELQAKIKDNSKVLVHYSKNKDPKQALLICIQREMNYDTRAYEGVLNPERYKFQNFTTAAMAEVFSDKWNSDEFRYNTFPVYLALARNPENMTEQLIDALPHKVRPLIDKEKITVLRSKLKELEVAVAAHPSVIAHYSEDNIAKYALDSIIREQIGYNVDTYKNLLNEEQYRYNDKITGSMILVFGERWNSPEFRTDILPIYLALARRPETETDGLIQALHADIAAKTQINRGEIILLRAQLDQLEAMMPQNVRSDFFSNIDTKPPLDLCIQNLTEFNSRTYEGTLDPKRYQLEIDVENQVAGVFGDEWNDQNFRTQIFPIYLGLANALSEEPMTEGELTQLLPLLPDEARSKIPGNHVIQPEKILRLKKLYLKLKEETMSISANSDFYIKDQRSSRAQRALESCIKHSIPYKGSMHQLGGVIYTNLFYLKHYWTNPKYVNIVDKEQVFKMALAMKEADDFNETLDFVIKFMKSDKAGFTADFDAWKAGLLVGNSMTNKEFLNQCEQRYPAVQADVPAI